MVDPRPHKGFIPYLLLDGADAAMKFYAEAFGATERYRMSMPDGSVAHAEMEIDGDLFYLSDAPDDMGWEGAGNPAKVGGTAVLLHRYVDDVDATFERAIAAGAKAVQPPEDQFYGDRATTIADPFGHWWSLHTHIKDMTPEEMEAAAAAAMGG